MKSTIQRNMPAKLDRVLLFSLTSYKDDLKGNFVNLDKTNNFPSYTNTLFQ